MVKIGINGAGKEDLRGEAVVVGFVFQIIDVQLDLGALDHFFDHRGVTADGDALKAVGEVVIVIGEADREALDDEGREIFGWAIPLFLGVTSDKNLVELVADLGQDPVF